MNDSKPNWDDLRIFAAIAATGSLTGAAAHLRLSQPTVGRRLPELQAGLPGIEVELFSEMAFANLARREADIAIRNRRPAEGRVAVRRLPDPTYAVFGARSYVERNPAA